MNKDKPILYLIRGVAGAGKSTFANLLNQHAMTMINLEADDYLQVIIKIQILLIITLIRQN